MRIFAGVPLRGGVKRQGVVEIGDFQCFQSLYLRSLQRQLLEVLDKWSEVLDNGSKLDAVYLDFSKAFDSVPHKRLLIKLQSYGVEG